MYSKSKFYLRTMRCVEKYYRGVRRYEHRIQYRYPTYLEHTHVSTLSLLPLPSVAYVEHQLKPNSTAAVLKGFFYTLETWRTYAERNKWQCEPHLRFPHASAHVYKGVRGDGRVRVSIVDRCETTSVLYTGWNVRQRNSGFFKSTRNSVIMNERELKKEKRGGGKKERPEKIASVHRYA